MTVEPGYFARIFSERFSGKRVMLHSSFSPIGRRLRVSPAYFVDEILESSIQALAVPALKWRFLPEAGSCSLHRQAWTEIDTGVLAKQVLARPSVARSIHPTHSFAAIGDCGNVFNLSHYMASSQCGLGSPWEEFVGDRDAVVLMLNCGLEAATVCHVAEELIAPDVYLSDAPVVVNFYPDGETELILSVRRHRRVKRHYEKLRTKSPELYFRAFKDDYGNSYLWFMAEQIHELSVAALRKNPMFFLET